MLKKLNLIIGLCLITLSCSIDREALSFTAADGTQVLITTVNIENGDICPNGGTAINFGVDLNSDGILSVEEIQQTANVCNGQDGQDGADGLNSLIVTTGVDASDESPCPNGGALIQTGLDSNLNGVLDPDEIISSTYICSGVDGTNGQDGADGQDGVSSTITTEEVEPSEEHPYGGYYLYITTGDVTEVIFISNGITGERGPQGIPGIDGEDGISASITTVYVEPNENQPYGGYILIITYGEYTETVFISNGADGTNGLDGQDGQDGVNGQDGIDGIDGVSSTIQTEETEGGYFIHITVGGETTTIFISDGTDGEDGADGLNSLVNVIPNSPDEDSTTIQIGLDDNGNGILESSEVDETIIVSNGQDGADGQDGATSYVNVEINLDCDYGGFIITTWIDNDGDGVYDSSIDELVDTEEYCNPTPNSDTIIICHEMSGQQNSETYDPIWNEYDFIQLTMTFSEYTYHKLVVHGGQSTQNDTFSVCDPSDGTILEVTGGIPQ